MQNRECKIAKPLLMGLFLFAGALLPAQDAHTWLRKGDKAYKSQKFAEAELNYRRAIEKEASPKATYNLGNSIYRQERYEEAAKHYKSAIESIQDDKARAKAWHNLGNAHYQKGEYKESLEAYKNALRIAPEDEETRRNFANALRRLPPPSPQNQQEQSQDSRQQPQPQNQQNQPAQQPNDPTGQQDRNHAQEQPQDNTPQQQLQQSISQEEARQLLEIMDREEQKVQQKLKKSNSAKYKSGKDW